MKRHEPEPKKKAPAPSPAPKKDPVPDPDQEPDLAPAAAAASSYDPEPDEEDDPLATGDLSMDLNESIDPITLLRRLYNSMTPGATVIFSPPLDSSLPPSIPGLRFCGGEQDENGVQMWQFNRLGLESLLRTIGFVNIRYIDGAFHASR